MLKKSDSSAKALNDILLFVAAGLLFALAALPFINFVLDDAYITFRYSENLVRSGEIIWNLGEDPVEGFTSMLWMLLNAGGILLGIDPVVFSKIVSFIAGIGILWLLISSTRAVDFRLKCIFLGAFCLSPVFGFLSMQGMETVLTAFLVLSSSLTILAFMDKPEKTLNLVLTLVLFVLCFLARPDTIVFNGTAYLAMLFITLKNKNYATFGRLVLLGLATAVILLIYAVWKLHYFGYLLPTAGYLKFSSGEYILRRYGIKYAVSFILNILSAYLVFALMLYKYLDKGGLRKTFPLICGFIAFILYLTTVEPIQGHLWRFAYPVYPVFILILSILYAKVNLKDIPILRKRAVIIILLLLFAYWPLRFIPNAVFQAKARNQHDRVQIGKSLAGIDGRMFVIGSGAVPYYSKWKAIDWYGLNSEEIAHKGFSRDILDRFQPEFIMLMVRDMYKKPKDKAEIIINDYMRENNFEALAVIQRWRGIHQIYFVCKDSPHYDEIVKRVLSIPDIKYADMDEIVVWKSVPLHRPKTESQSTRLDSY